MSGEGSPAAALLEVEIRPARIGDSVDFAAYVVEHVAESGQDGAPVFALSRTASREDVKNRALELWIRSLAEPLWGRAWLLWESGAAGRVVGHLELLGGRVPAEMHRAVLAMGIRQAFTGKGHGARLMKTAIAWGRSEAKLSWIDLGVFSGNTPARKLYTRMGFVEQGVRRDAFRVDGGISIDDIQMTLAL